MGNGGFGICEPRYAVLFPRHRGCGNIQEFRLQFRIESRRNIRITEHGDQNENYRRTYNETTLYKPVKEDWTSS